MSEKKNNYYIKKCVKKFRENIRKSTLAESERRCFASSDVFASSPAKDGVENDAGNISPTVNGLPESDIVAVPGTSGVSTFSS